MRKSLNYSAVFAAFISVNVGACTDESSLPDEDVTTIESEIDSASINRGRDIWFENTYGGEKFFAFLAQHPDPSKRIKVGFEAVIETPRESRFEIWGTINDPDCEANPEGGADICPDPTATGVIGMRKLDTPQGPLFGVACAACHAGINPVDPPANIAEPTWDNIHATIGNQYLQFGAIFAANLAPTDVRALMFAAWPNGSVDTSLLFSDNIMNPGVVTAFWEHAKRRTFDVGMDVEKLRNGQGGEDDVGGDLAALRVYTNIGVCFFECVAGPATIGAEIDIQTCHDTCSDFPPQVDLDDMGNFLASFSAPQYPGSVHLKFLYAYGKHKFNKSCAGCHTNTGQQKTVLSNDEVNALVDDPVNATNKCRALSSNWEAGKIWGQFSSDVYKDRVAAGNKGYRTMPLGGIWSTSPFLHNQSIGGVAPADASPLERSAYYWGAMFELLNADRDPVVNTLPIAVGPFPAGTPLAYVFSRNPNTGELLCDDVVENRGHYFGTDLSFFDKSALIYYLQYQ